MLNKTYYEGYCSPYEAFLQLMGKEPVLSNSLYIKTPSFMVISKFKNLPWSPWCSTLTSSSFGYILQIEIANSPPSFIAYHQWSALLSGNVLLWFYQNKLVMTCILLYRNIKNNLPKMLLSQFPLGCQLPVSRLH